MSPGPRVLIVDDDPALLDALPRALTLRLPTLQVEVCDSGPSAIERVRAVDYDAIVTDIKMPGMDGLELLAIIQEFRPKTPTLLITGHGEHDLAVQALRGGAYDFIQKPIDRDYFIASLGRALEMSALQRQVETHRAALERRADELEHAVHARTRQLLEANAAKDEIIEQRERALGEARAAQRRLAFLAEASSLLTSRDYESTLHEIARLAVPTLGTACIVDIDASELGGRRQVVAAAEQEREATLQKLLMDDHVLGTTAAALYGAFTDSPEGIVIDPSEIERNQPRLLPGWQALLRTLGERSVMLFPLTAHDRTLGTIGFGLGDSTQRYGADDVALARDVAGRCALALENALLFTASQRIGEELRRTSEAKDEFLALISHEMRTPLTTVYGSAQMLWRREAQLSPERRSELIDVLARESERLRRIVEDLLVLARVEVGAGPPLEPVSLVGIVRSGIQRFMKFREDREVRFDAPADLPPVMAEQTYVEQVLHNLLTNADKYSPSTEPIEIRAGITGADAWVSVLDRGVGVAPHEVDLIFERFYRSERAGGTGVGMGLTVCRRLVEALSGRIGAALRDGGGLEVTFSLPLWKHEEEPALLEDDESESDEPGTAHAHSATVSDSVRQ